MARLAHPNGNLGLQGIQQLFVDFVVFEVEVLTPRAVATEALFEKIAAGFGLVGLVGQGLGAELGFAMGVAAVRTPFAETLELEIPANLGFVLPTVLEMA